MTYPLLTLADETELIHSEMGSDGQVRVDIEQPDAQLCFKTASCWLPGYTWENVIEFSQDEMAKFREVIESCAHLMIEFAQTGGFEHASFLDLARTGTGINRITRLR